ncbi:hypothetical protein [Maricaulis sp.]|uniref:hypothetical protein n=1 Tax=Maricaulis sp. TaxID=1486257 RepID=UPI003A90183F
MGQAAVRPEFLTARRALAWALALLANGALIGLVLLAPRPRTGPPTLQTIDLVLVAAALPETEAVPDEPPVAPDPEPVPDPDPAPDPRPEPEERPESQTSDAPETQAISGNEGETDEGEIDSSQPGLGADGLPDYGIVALPETAALTGTPFVIREVFCLTSSDATREAGHCPDGPDPEGLSMLRYASDGNIEAGMRAAIASGLSAAEIRALFEDEGLPLADLSGQPTMADPGARATSSADQMRDSLPPRHPDPAFGN